MQVMKFYVYELYRKEEEIDWIASAEAGKDVYKQVLNCINRAIVNDPSDNICIGGRGADGKYHQFDSAEAYYAADYFADAERAEAKLCIRSFPVEIPYEELKKYAKY